MVSKPFRMPDLIPKIEDLVIKNNTAPTARMHDTMAIRKPSIPDVTMSQ